MRLGLVGTPTVYVRGIQIDGALPERIEAELKASEVQGESHSEMWREKEAIQATLAVIGMIRQRATHEDFERSYGAQAGWADLEKVGQIQHHLFLGTQIAPLDSLSQIQVRMFLQSDEGAWRLALRWDVKREWVKLLSVELKPQVR